MQIDQQHDELVQAVGERCLQHGWMLVCAESCTGGLLSARLTDMPGSSNWFERGYVTYSNTAKVELLHGVFRLCPSCGPGYFYPGGNTYIRR